MPYNNYCFTVQSSVLWVAFENLSIVCGVLSETRYFTNSVTRLYPHGTLLPTPDLTCISNVLHDVCLLLHVNHVYYQ